MIRWRSHRLGLVLLSTATLIGYSATGKAQNTQPAGATGDSGTPAATAKLAAAAGFIDVVGVKLGMPLKDALGALKTNNPKFTIDALAMNNVDSVPTPEFIHAILARVPTRDESRAELLKPGDVSETMLLSLALSPNPPVVYYIGRRLEWVGQKGPSVDTVVSGLRQKYGSETSVSGFGGYELARKSPVFTLTWVYQGQTLLPPNQRPALNCAAQRGPSLVGALITISGNKDAPLGFDYGDASRYRQKSGLLMVPDVRPLEYFRNGVDLGPLKCGGPAVSVMLHLEPKSGQMWAMEMHAVSAATVSSAFAATRAMLAQAVNEKIQKEKDEAAKRGAPKL